MEIQKLKEELRKTENDKEALETEIKQRNEELYQMNQRMIFIEFEKQSQQLNLGDPTVKVNEL